MVRPGIENIPVDRLAIAFSNPIDEKKVLRYRKKLRLMEAPPIKFYRRTVDETDLGRLQFLNRDAEESDLGLPVYYIKDGYHRAYAYLEERRSTIRGRDIEAGRRIK